MYQQRMKLQQISMIALALACLITIIAIVKSILLLMLLVYYGITLSLACEGLICLMDFKKQAALRLLIIALLLFIMTTALLFQILTS